MLHLLVILMCLATLMNIVLSVLVDSDVDLTVSSVVESRGPRLCRRDAVLRTNPPELPAALPPS